MAESSKKSNLVVAALLEYLDESKQENLLPEVVKILEADLSSSHIAEAIIVKSPIYLSPNQLKKVQQIISKTVRGELPIKNIIDKSIIGGFIAYAGDYFLDASLNKDLNKLKFTLLS